MSERLTYAQDSPALGSGLWRTRVAVVLLFFLSGLTLAMWVANIPTIGATAELSHSMLGGLLLVLGAGSLVGMQLSGHAIDRVGSKVVAMSAIPLLVIGILIPGIFTTWIGIGIALFIVGVGQGLIDVAMNDQAVLVEQRWGHPIMSSFHAFFSVGGAAGAVLAAMLQNWGLPLMAILAVGASTVIPLAALSSPRLIKASERHIPDSTTDRDADDVASAPVSRRTVLMLAVVAFILTLAEGSANDWSALHAVQGLKVSESAGSLAFAAFATGMTVGRFSADRVVRKVGATRLIRCGAMLAAAGLLLAVTVPLYPVVLLGWLLFGLGLAGGLPQVFTAAGNLGDRTQGKTMARVIGSGYIGLLAGPAVIGWASELVGLNLAMLIPFVLCLIAMVMAGRVRVEIRTVPRPGPPESSA